MCICVCMCVQDLSPESQSLEKLEWSNPMLPFRQPFCPIGDIFNGHSGGDTTDISQVKARGC